MTFSDCESKTKIPHWEPTSHVGPCTVFYTVLIATVLDCVPAHCMLIFEEGTVPFIKFEQAVTDSGLMLVMKDVCFLVETKIQVQNIS